MKVLVCGGREYADKATVFEVLDELNRRVRISQIIHGAARGADTLAGQWARSRTINERKFPAEWDRYGKTAGYRRNVQMLIEGKPDIVVAFPGGRGTANMRTQAEKAGLKVLRIE